MKEKFIISLISQVVSSLGFIFAFYLLFLNLDKSALGIWALLNSIINLGFLFINIGLDSIHYQYSSKKNSSEYLGTFFTIKITLLLINVLVAIFFITIFSFTQSWSNQYSIMLLFLLFSKIFFNIAQIFFINLKSKIKVFRAEIPLFFITIGKSLSIIFLSINLSQFSNPILFLCVSLFLFNLSYLILILLFSKNEFKLNKPRKDLTLLYLKDVKPLFFFSITLVIATNLGNVILRYSFGLEELGNFSFINNFIIESLLLISGSIATIYLTLFSKFFEEKDLESIKKITYIIEKYFSIFFLWIIVIVFLNGGLMFSVFMPQYIETGSLLNIMIFIPYLIAITNPYSYHFIAGKKQQINAYINMVTRITIIVLMICLIPSKILIIQFLGLGSLGYALSLTLPWILWAIINRYYSYKTFNIKPQKNIILHILVAIFSLLISYTLKNLIFKYIFQNHIQLLIVSSIFSLLLFITCLFIFKELRREDIKFFIQLIKLQNYKDSLREEFSDQT